MHIKEYLNRSLCKWSMNKQFVAWTNRVTDIEVRISENPGKTSVHSEEVDVDQLSIHPNECSVFTTDKLATEAPLAGVCPSLVDDESTNMTDNANTVITEAENPCNFFDPANSFVRRWSPLDPFREFLEKNLRRRPTLDQVNEIIGGNSLPETDACVAPSLGKEILNCVPANRKKFVEQRDKREF